MSAYYAVFGGEYSVFDLRRARIDAEAERVEVAELRRMIDSLGAWSDSLQHDSATLERVAPSANSKNQTSLPSES